MKENSTKAIRRRRARIAKYTYSALGKIPVPCWMLTWPLGDRHYFFFDTWDEAVVTFNYLRRRWA